MARYKTRSKHVNRSRSRTRKQRGGFFDFLTNLFKPKNENTVANAPAATDNNPPPPAAAPAPQEPQQPPAQAGGSRKKSKKHHHRRHRK